MEPIKQTVENNVFLPLKTCRRGERLILKETTDLLEMVKLSMDTFWMARLIGLKLSFFF